ncbi:MAG TPA: glycosyltransferase [Acetobacteraceae bacterium]|nr:glycosyltransferase [Acetobacteraceae bacterium]
MSITLQPGTVEAQAPADRPMRLLLVSYWFPPTNAIGAVRTGKFAKYMHEAGHAIRVIAGPRAAPLSLPLEIPRAAVSRPGEPAPFPPPQRANAIAPVSGDVGPRSSRAKEMLRRHWYALRQIPDKQAAWIVPAVTQGNAVLRDFRPDLILASAPPYSGLIAAARLSAASGVPWVAELRDPWFGNSYNDRPAWRDWLDRVMERRTLGSAAALVAVSPVVARDLGKEYRQPIATILNDYAPEDLPPPCPRAPHGTLSIVYTGTIYEGHRDPSPLFAAIARLPEASRRRVRVVFYGPSECQVAALAERCGVREQVVVMPNVGYRDSLAVQAEADILLLLQRNHPSDEGNLPAKAFEYLGALRPILLLGYEKGVLAEMIRARNAGLVANDPDQIAARLEAWIDQLAGGGIPALPRSAGAGLSRVEQFAEYERFLRAHARV